VLVERDRLAILRSLAGEEGIGVGADAGTGDDDET